MVRGVRYCCSCLSWSPLSGGLWSGGKFLFFNHGYVKGLIVVARSIERKGLE